MPGQAFRPYARAASSWGRCGGWKAHEVVVARFGLRDVFRGVVYALRLDQVKTRESVTGEPSSRNPHRHVAHAVACMQAAASSRRAVEPQKCFTDGPLASGNLLQGEAAAQLELQLSKFRTYALEWNPIAQPVQLQPNAELGPNGSSFPGVLERLRDESPERFEVTRAQSR